MANGAGLSSSTPPVRYPSTVHNVIDSAISGAFATDNPIDVNDPLELNTLTRKTNLAPVTVTAKGKKPLDTQNGQVFQPCSGITEFFLGHRIWVGHTIGFPVRYETNKDGYLTGVVAPREMVFDAPVRNKPINLKAILNIKNFIKGRYAVYRGMTVNEDAGALHLAEDEAYVSGYTLNNQGMAQVKIPSYVFRVLKQEGLITTAEGFNSVTGQRGLEYIISNPALKEAILKILTK